jgi:tRNA nucleotidyltransferase (CCA-adding enzyme)
MKTFLVGGAVRDQVLGLQPKDEDWVVVGSTPEEMVQHGFHQVGADFPVFLDQKGNEFALARTERKVGVGHKGFETVHDSSVSLEDDLMRRDFTMNAMARDASGAIIDPFNGRQDIADRVIRHVSDAFRDDPLRVLRAARFAARFDFEIADETMALMREMVASGELDSLSKERVWKEVSRAMSEPFASNFFFVMGDVGAKHILGLDDDLDFNFDTLEKVIAFTADRMDVRWMALSETMDRRNMNRFISTVGVPNDETRAMRLFAALLEAGTVSEFMEVAKKFRLFSPEGQSLVTAACLVVSMMPVDDETMWSILKPLHGIRKASMVSFNSLDERRRIMLRGSDIGKAIDGERLKVISAEANA